MTGVTSEHDARASLVSFPTEGGLVRNASDWWEQAIFVFDVGGGGFLLRDMSFRLPHSARSGDDRSSFRKTAHANGSEAILQHEASPLNRCRWFS